ncbi:prefoldin subunit 4-like [Branchiostoma floridae]|uniref:Prefoldin subunit 4 n=1 Tax=Branchiostoma floridae TaxID=7739 RepID=A0A9J7LAF9_BRAFL|nr:prefoldin subunit 4-like [Branchiostoma floridae]
MATVSLKPSQGDADVQVTYEDQQKINTFANKNAKLVELKEEVEAKQKELQNLEDASDDLLMVDDESAPIPYRIGEVFISMPLEATQEKLEEAKAQIQQQIADLNGQADEIKGVLGKLKVELYAKFSNNINLEMDEE